MIKKKVHNMKFFTKYKLYLMYIALVTITLYNFYITYLTQSIISAVMSGICTGYLLFIIGARPLINTYKEQIDMQDKLFMNITHTYLQTSELARKNLESSKQLILELQTKLDKFEKLHEELHPNND